MRMSSSSVFVSAFAQSGLIEQARDAKVAGQPDGPEGGREHRPWRTDAQVRGECEADATTATAGPPACVATSTRWHDHVEL